MKLGTLRRGGRDGTLVVVSSDLARAVAVPSIAPTLQRALDSWSSVCERLGEVSDDLNAGRIDDAFELRLRGLIPAELAKGFGFLHGKPPSAFAPVAVTPDKLGGAWDGCKANLELTVELNDARFGSPNAGMDMHFDFPQLILAAGMRDHFRLDPGTRVAVFMRNTPEYLLLLFAAWHAGLAVVPINSKLHAKELAWILADCTPGTLFITPELAATAAAAAANASIAMQVVEVPSPSWHVLLNTAPEAGRSICGHHNT